MGITDKIGNWAAWALLWPLSLLWNSIYRLRRNAYRFGLFKQESFAVPIISIGNLSFGGTGKTPFTLWLANELDKRQKKVMILMRGYKGKLENHSGILSGDVKMGSTPQDYGDEAILLSRRLPHASVVVGKNRSENLLRYFDEVSPDIILLDDGHQHLKIARQLNIVLFDAMAPLSQLKVAPLGYLREGLEALSDADLIIFSRVAQASKAKIERIKKTLSPFIDHDTPMAEVDYQAIGLFHDHSSRPLPIEEIKDKKVICLAAVAAPASFFRLVDSLGAVVVKSFSYPDHHDFNPNDIEQVLQLASQLDAIIITTEKDIVKVRRITDDKRIYFLEIGIYFKNGQEHVWGLVDQLLNP